MKKFLYGCLIVLIAVLCSTALNMTLTSCESSSAFKTPKVTVSKAQVSLCVDSLINPSFDEFSDVVELQKQMAVAKYTDSVFLTIPTKTLQDVYTVLSKKKANVYKEDIVEEFMSNKEIYENLPPGSSGDVSNTVSSTKITQIAPLIVQEEKTTVTEAPPTRVDNPAGSYKDTVIDGKRAIIEK